jgi:nitrogen regulatory protein PII
VKKVEAIIKPFKLDDVKEALVVSDQLARRWPS